RSDVTARSRETSRTSRILSAEMEYWRVMELIVGASRIRERAGGCKIGGERVVDQYCGPPGLMSLFQSRIPPAMLLTFLKPCWRRSWANWRDREPLRQWTMTSSPA